MLILAFSQVERDSFETTYLPLPYFSPGKTSFTDEELVQAMFSTYKYPLNFYSEDLTIWESLTLLPGCSQTWEEATAIRFPDSRSASVKFLQAGETERYFQFVRDRDPNDKSRDFSRLHKCTYLDIVSLRENEYRLRFNLRPLTSKDVKDLIEYLWFVRSRHAGGLKILSSNTEELDRGFRHTLYVIDGVYEDNEALAVNPARTKRIEIAQIMLKRLEFFIDRNTGELSTTVVAIREIKGQSEPLSVLR